MIIGICFNNGLADCRTANANAVLVGFLFNKVTVFIFIF